jgi:dynactin complex subunit
MQSAIESKLQSLQKELDTLQNKRIPFSDVKTYKENYLNIRLCKEQIAHLYKMIEDEDFGITL